MDITGISINGYDFGSSKTIERPSDTHTRDLKACKYKFPATMVGPNLLVCGHASFNVLYGQKYLLSLA